MTSKIKDKILHPEVIINDKIEDKLHHITWHKIFYQTRRKVRRQISGAYFQFVYINKKYSHET